MVIGSTFDGNSLLEDELATAGQVAPTLTSPRDIATVNLFSSTPPQISALPSSARGYRKAIIRPFLTPASNHNFFPFKAIWIKLAAGGMRV